MMTRKNGHLSTWGNNGYNHTGRHFAHIIEASVGQQFALGMSDQYSNPTNSHILSVVFSVYDRIDYDK